MNGRNPRAAGGVLGGAIDGPARAIHDYPQVEAVVGLRAVHRATRFLGAISCLDGEGVTLRGQSSAERVFRLTPGAFVVDGRPVTLVRPRPASRAQTPTRTASGSVGYAGPMRRAQTARASRIWVEGIHDAALVEKVWGDDLRELAIVVERLDGIDALVDRVDDFGPAPSRRLGILVDHLVRGSKEARLAEQVAGPNVLVRGTPFVDVWQAVRPRVIGIPAWPVVPKGEEWKDGMCRRLGKGDPPSFWRYLLDSVTSYADLEPDFVGAVEELIDHVSIGETAT